MREALQTDDGCMFEIHDDPILADETRMWQDNEPVLSSSLRPADRRLTTKQRHEKLGHLGAAPAAASARKSCEDRDHLCKQHGGTAGNVQHRAQKSTLRTAGIRVRGCVGVFLTPRSERKLAHATQTGRLRGAAAFGGPGTLVGFGKGPIRF